MKLNNTVITLALVGVLALAALAGGLLPMGNVAHAQEATPANRPPEFTAGEADTRSIEENTPPGVNIGEPVTATDPDEDGEGDDDLEFGETLTYSLEGADADSFNLDPLTGQLSTRVPLDFEAPTDVGDTAANNTYEVIVRARDSRGGSDTITVTITVNNGTDEPPFAPAAPTVVSGPDSTDTADADESTTRLRVVWHPPENMGARTINEYTYRYRSTTAGTWSDGVPVGTDLTATISDLRVNTTYLVSVRATSDEGTSPWSLSGTGATNKTGNSVPAFAAAIFTPTLPENSPGGQNVDLPITARDSDTRALSYRLEGPDAAMFDFITSSGQIRTKRGVTYDHEDPSCGYVDAPTDTATTSTTSCRHYVTVAAFDGAGGSDAVRVVISVSDRPEIPSRPAAPTVRATESTTTSLDVSWNPPANAGPPITGYNVQYRRRGSNDNFSSGGVPDTTAGDDDTTVAGASTTISGVDPTNDNTPWLRRGTRYEVRIEAVTTEGTSLWSDPGTGSTNLGNLEPVFRDRPPSGDGEVGTNLSVVRTMDENTPPGRPVDRAVAANDGNADKLTYRLTGDDAALFDIDGSTGQIRTRASVAYNYETMTEADNDCGDFTEQTIRTNRCYTVTVEVRDGLNENKERVENEDADDSATVLIGVRNVPEPPAAPTVTVTSPTTVTTLAVTWDVPANTGPDITGYDVEYKQGSGGWSDDNCREVEEDENCDGLTDTTTTIVRLTINTPYTVRVRATNEEGDSSWTTVTGTTNRNRRDSDTANEAPTFSGASPTLTVDENTPSGQDIGSPVRADAELASEGDRFTYSLEGAERNSFVIDRTTGQIRTRVRLNHEAPACYDPDPDGDPSTDNSTCTYMVRVKVVDGQGGSASQNVTINVGDLPEPPSAPAPPRVTPTKDSGLSLEVSWSEPRGNTGPAITDYDIQYREYRTGTDQAGWEDSTHSTVEGGNTDRSATITGLDPGTAYEVQVQAVNHEGNSAWSNAGRGTTGASNTRPVFEDPSAIVTLMVDENTRAGQDVGSSVSATDDDGHRLSYSLDGPDASSFDINGSTGRIRTRSGVSYDYESKSSYSVTVKVDDRQRKANSVTAKSVTIELRDVVEPPSAPRAPRVTGVPGSTDSIRVTWDEPANTGPPIIYYQVQFGQAGTGGFLPVGLRIEDTSVIITGLTPGTRYDVQVRAWNAEDHGEYSRSGTGAPNADIRNRNPRFTGGGRSFSVGENTGAGVAIGVPVTAIDDDDDPLSYSLAGTDAASFDIDSVSGQMRTRESLNFEEKSSHSVTVRARDNRGGSGTVDVRITVTDVDEPPDTPDAPTVTALSSMSLQVTWEAPGNTGPPITDYDYRHRGPTGDWTEVTNTRIAATSVTIEGLTASTFYDVAVRAKNAEGTSEWSNAGFGSTNAPGANNPPVFSEGASAARSVSATAPSGTLIGEPVAATDADSDDTVEYSLEGPAAASFDITETNGQLRTKSGVRLTAGTEYEVTVVATDGTDAARIAVTITATAAPPNRPPVFSGGPRSFRVLEGTAAGTSIGSPVRATDADTGDTLTYSLEGTDAASFTIVSTSGQIRTRAALDASTKATYSVTVKATDTRGGSATIAVTITVTARPTTFGCATQGAVDASNTLLVSDCEALMASRNLLEGNTGRLNWSPSRSMDQWEGVYLGGTPARVTRVILRRYGLDGSVPADLGRLSMLTELNLHTNDLTGGIPSDLARLSRLEKLLLHNNQLNGTIPDLSRLGNLKMLWLSGRDMNLTGGVPTWLNRMSGLESVSLWGNSLSGPVPCLTGMSSLQLLKIQSNRLTGGVPSCLGDMSSTLRGLYIHNNPLGGTIPTELGRLTRLRRLWIHSSNLTGTIPPELANMANLGTLNLRGNGLTGSIPTELGRMSRLQDLLLHDNQLTGNIPTQLGGLSSLRRLWLSDNQLSGSIPTVLGNLSSLQQLNLHTNQLLGAIPSQLGNLSNLTRLRIGGVDGNRGNTGLSGCVPSALRAATDPGDLALAGASGIGICSP